MTVAKATLILFTMVTRFPELPTAWGVLPALAQATYFSRHLKGIGITAYKCNALKSGIMPMRITPSCAT
jgi:hypothetical protein